MVHKDLAVIVMVQDQVRTCYVHGAQEGYGRYKSVFEIATMLPYGLNRKSDMNAKFPKDCCAFQQPLPSVSYLYIVLDAHRVVDSSIRFQISSHIRASRPCSYLFGIPIITQRNLPSTHKLPHRILRFTHSTWKALIELLQRHERLKIADLQVLTPLMMIEHIFRRIVEAALVSTAREARTSNTCGDAADSVVGEAVLCVVIPELVSKVCVSSIAKFVACSKSQFVDVILDGRRVQPAFLRGAV
jgi:hypothetical protein